MWILKELDARLIVLSIFQDPYMDECKVQGLKKKTYMGRWCWHFDSSPASSQNCTKSNDVKMLSPLFPFSTPPLRTFPRRCELLGKLTTSCCCRVVPLLQIFGNLPKIDPSIDKDVVVLFDIYKTMICRPSGYSTLGTIKHRSAQKL